MRFGFSVEKGRRFRNRGGRYFRARGERLSTQSVRVLNRIYLPERRSLLHYASLTVRSLSTLVTPQCNPTMCNRTSCAKFTSCHNAFMVVTGRAHCSILYYILHSRYILLSTLMDWVESLSERRSLFALCIAHCSLFEHSGDSTMPILQCVTVHRVPKLTSCHNAIMVGLWCINLHTVLFRSLRSHQCSSEWFENWDMSTAQRVINTSLNDKQRHILFLNTRVLKLRRASNA